MHLLAKTRQAQNGSCDHQLLLLTCVSYVTHQLPRVLGPVLWLRTSQVQMEDAGLGRGGEGAAGITGSFNLKKSKQNGEEGNGGRFFSEHAGLQKAKAETAAERGSGSRTADVCRPWLPWCHPGGQQFPQCAPLLCSFCLGGSCSPRRAGEL